MVTGKGVPDLATRQLVYRLTTQFILPVVILTDCDPYGFEIALTYKFGSLAMAWVPERLAVPSAIWLGLLPSDLDELGIEEESMRPLSREDRKKIQDLHLRDYINDFCPQLIDELEILWRVGRKAEIQQVSQQIEDIITFTYQVSEEREPGFLAKTFLPSKLLHLEHQARNGDQLF